MAARTIRGSNGARKASGGRREIVTHEQWVDVSIDGEGRAVTKYYPPNAEMKRLLEEMDPQPDLIYRRMHFRFGVPPEYEWVTDDPMRRKNGGMAIQRMKVGTWLGTIEAEERMGGHLQECATVGRPKSRGICRCRECTANPDRYGREEEEG